MTDTQLVVEDATSNVPIIPSDIKQQRAAKSSVAERTEQQAQLINTLALNKLER